ncbi:MAG: hypothetical protein HQK54_16085 [Oligoflexales bacterium]|nr:hypothetical protein [Oligoflexales bacterium]
MARAKYFLIISATCILMTGGCVTLGGSGKKSDNNANTLITVEVDTIPFSYGPSPRSLHTAIWTGNAMLIWGGVLDQSIGRKVTGGGVYFPVTKKWQEIPLNNAYPVNIYNHSAVWTGSEFIYWGGIVNNSEKPSEEGERYNLKKKKWVMISDEDAPSARSGHSAIWSGDRMILWGGMGESSYLSDGAAYSPKKDEWEPIGNIDFEFAPRAYHVSLFTGREMLIWGGADENNYFNSGARYDLEKNLWRPMNLEGAPSPRVGSTAIWTGSKMIIWGGKDKDGNYLADGAIYDPKIDKWEDISLMNAPTGREAHSAIWDGKNMIIWGGHGSTGSFRTGGVYNIEKNSWKRLITDKKLMGRAMHSAVWTGLEMLVWGGKTRNSSVFLTDIAIGESLKIKTIDLNNKENDENPVH